MSFFDSKQDVLKIELTQIGKLMLSRGKFNPKYYAFFDDDVLYDTKYANLEEDQNDTQERILNETCVLKPQVTFSSLENGSKKLAESIISKENNSFLSFDTATNATSLLPLGNSELGGKFNPALNLEITNGNVINIETKNSNNNADNSFGNFLKVPQINLEDFYYKIKDMSPEEYTGTDPHEEVIGNVTLISGEQLNIVGNNEDTFSFYTILEKNSIDVNDNFELEIFMEDEEEINGEKVKLWKQLNFNKKPINVKNNILLDNQFPSSYFPLEPNNAEWYFELAFDQDMLDYANRNIQRGLVYGAVADLPIGRPDLPSRGPGGSGFLKNASTKRAGGMYSSEVTNDDKPFGEDC